MAFYNIQHRRGSTAQWASYNEILTPGELGIEEVGGGYVKVKIGNGMAPWNALPYITSGGPAPTLLAPFQSGHVYVAGEAIYDIASGDILIAKTGFTSGPILDRSNWYGVGNIIPQFVAGTAYGADSVIYDPTKGLLYISKSDLGTPSSFNPNDWYEIGTAAALPFTANKTYKAGELVTYNGVLYYASVAFTAGTSFNPANRRQVGVTIILGYHNNTFYYQDQAVLYHGGIYTAVADFTSSTQELDPSQWYLADKSIAAGFSAYLFYNEGEVIYDSTTTNLYRAKAAFTAGGAFDPTDWDLIGSEYYLARVEEDGTYKSMFFHENDGGGYQFIDKTNSIEHFAAGNELYYKQLPAGVGQKEARILEFTRSDGNFAYGYQTGLQNGSGVLPTIGDGNEILTKSGNLPFIQITGNPYDQTNLAVELNKIGDLSILDPNLGSPSDLVSAINTTYSKAEASVNIKGYLDFGAALLTDMQAIPTAALAVGNTCGVHETQKTYQRDGTTWNELATTGDELGDQYIVESFYGTFKGNAYTGNAGAIITCIQITPTVEYALQVMG
jgi:hypothetical protein